MSILNIQSRRAWTGTLFAAVLFMVVVPALNTFLPEGSILHIPDYMIQLLGKFLSYALCALAIDLIWGFTGILSLGHGVFFAFGGYAMGMHLIDRKSVV